MKIWFTADTHLGHNNIREYSHRPFATVEEMDETIINNWNSLVAKTDIIYHLGDFCFGKNSRDFDRYINALQGNIVFIKGNHDKLAYYNKQKFAAYYDSYHEIVIDQQHITLCHYPILTWNKKHFGALMLHGHCHYTLLTSRKESKELGKILDVGVDGNNYMPYSLGDVLEIMKNKPIDPELAIYKDQHTGRNKTI